jgi:hypothetical protein
MSTGKGGVLREETLSERMRTNICMRSRDDGGWPCRAAHPCSSKRGGKAATCKVPTSFPNHASHSRFSIVASINMPNGEKGR